MLKIAKVSAIEFIITTNSKKTSPGNLWNSAFSIFINLVTVDMFIKKYG